MKLFCTFTIGGPLNGYYAEIEAETKLQIQQFAKLHWSIDWAGIYSADAFEHQPAEFNLRRLCVGAVEEYPAGVLHWHEGKTLAEIS